ncbi:alpha-D-ribose 1-methylphosphonate 5-triphosphate diphosphatase [Actibacterium sp. MT2.3-13A]|uniref:alpha-D-ribose 1-methylphosphonate 5-triphosphate diphosphatase n=1 Tax=Actibacterium sp. MT2.3-13A TaxID=2828332 RepID=UPI001BA63A2C|nr:alpha-D-ribose 1-methylphosphonate 5-triphosphate diphosphatase [Actibacterium sp. MT2.3-13A]
MLSLTLTNADILMPGGLIGAKLAIEGGRIAPTPAGRAVDLSGCLVLPGIVDMHGDGFERHLAPRRGAMRDLGEGLAALDAELAANGITTAVLAQFFSWEAGMRGPDFAEGLAGALAAAGSRLLCDMRLQLRLETHLLDDYPRAEALIEGAGIGYVVFNDHLPHKALAEGKRPPRLTGQALKSGRSPEAHLAVLERLHARGAEVPQALSDLAGRLAARGVAMGSHDDATPETRAFYRAIGATISEFPETREAAQAARAAGDPVILGAPNVVRGGSHSGKVSAADLVTQGCCDALVSDYHYPAPRQAALALAGAAGLADAWALVSSRPARLLGLTDRGTLEPGKRADLVVLERDSGRVGATISGGRIAYLAGTVAERFLH